MSDDLDIKQVEEILAALTEALETQDKAAIQRKLQALAIIPGVEKGGESGDTITVGDISGSTGVAIGQYITQVIKQYDLAPELASQLEAALAAFTEATERQQERQRRNRIIGLSAAGVLAAAAVVAGIVLLGTGGNLQPAISLPLPVVVAESAGCEAARESIITGIEQVDDVVIAKADPVNGSQLHIDLTCDGADIQATVQFPAAAYPLDYLDEPPTLSVEGSQEDAAEFAQAAAAYASGDYALAYFYLSGDQDPNPDQALLAAQALMHMVNTDTGDRDWDDVREAYTQVIEHKQANEDFQARAYAGHGLSYVLEVQKAIAQGEIDDLMELKEACDSQARADFGEALDRQPDRAWWWASRPLVEMHCSLEYLPDVGTMQPDAEQAVTLSNGSGSRDEALARATLALILTVYADTPNYSRAETLSQAANEIDPTLALPYALLSCIATDDDPGAARRLYHDYIDRLYTPWQREQAGQNLRNQVYCP